MGNDFFAYKNRAALALVLTIVLTAQSSLVHAADTTWGRLKTLYQTRGYTLDPELSSLEAEAAVATAMRDDRLGTTVQGVCLVGVYEGARFILVTGRTRAGYRAAHLVTDGGEYVAGADLRLENGIARDAATGTIMWKAKTGDPARELQGVYRTADLGDVIRSLCNMVTGSLLTKCVGAVATGWGFLACLGMAAVLIAICNGEIDLELDEPVIPGCTVCPPVADRPERRNGP